MRGCSLVSEGCRNCYAMKQAHRFSGKDQSYEGTTKLGPDGPTWTGKIRQVHEALEQPLRWEKSRKVFVNSMSDLFHEDVDHTFLRRVFAVMALTPHITYQILTKRPARMLEKLTLNTFGKAVIGEAWCMLGHFPKFKHQNILQRPWPLPNVWLGVTVENQDAASIRIPLLLRTPAAIRFISAEPLLEQVTIVPYCGGRTYHCPCGYKATESEMIFTGGNNYSCKECLKQCTIEPSLDWVIVGGESGSGARVCEVDWIRWIKEQCHDTGTRIFIKQLGSKPNSTRDHISHRGYRGERPDGFYRFLNDSKGGDIAEFPIDLQIREFPR